MIKTKLPVIILKNMILLPTGEIKLELQNNEDKIVVENGINAHRGYILLVTPKFALNDKIDINNLPNYGVIGKINSNFELPNNNIRIDLLGINRAFIYDYIEEDDMHISAIIGPVSMPKISKDEEEAKKRILKKEINNYAKVIPTFSKYILNKINDEESLENLTDFIANILPLDFDFKYNLIEETDAIKRSNLLINKIIDERNISSLEKDIEDNLQVEMDKDQKEYVLREKIKIIQKELGEEDNKEDEIIELNNKISKLKAPKNIKDRLYKEVKKYNSIPFSSPEVTITKNYIDTMLSLPWGIKTKDEEDLDKSREILNDSHYGLDKIKERIIEYIAVNKLTKENKTPILCLVGPPGIGKTTLAFSIAKALNKNFVKISVGGVGDEAEILGHRRTYIGAEPGRIINGMIKAKSMNPVFLIDEIDKMTKNINGDPESAMLEVLDKEQNKYFKDNFLEEEFDLSNVMFILTANDINNIPYPLLDRLEIIELSSYTKFEKLNIVKNLMFDKLLKDHGLTKNNIEISDEVIFYIIENYTKEAGVRELERELSTIMRKIAKKVLTNPNTKEIITISNLNTYLGKEKYHIINNIKNEVGVVNGLAYTPFGGTILPIEVSYYKGNGQIILTGSLGEVMKESAEIAIGYIKSNNKIFNIPDNFFSKNDIHINAVEGAVPKEGPSAGITLVTAIISSITNKKISDKIAMTGEISLKGNILPIGGLKEKAIGAYNSKIEKIYVPLENKNDLDEIPVEVKNNLNIKLVDDYIQVYDELFK